MFTPSPSMRKVIGLVWWQLDPVTIFSRSWYRVLKLVLLVTQLIVAIMMHTVSKMIRLNGLLAAAFDFNWHFSADTFHVYVMLSRVWRLNCFEMTTKTLQWNTTSVQCFDGAMSLCMKVVVSHIFISCNVSAECNNDVCVGVLSCCCI